MHIYTYMFIYIYMQGLLNSIVHTHIYVWYSVITHFVLDDRGLTCAVTVILVWPLTLPQHQRRHPLALQLLKSHCRCGGGASSSPGPPLQTQCSPIAGAGAQESTARVNSGHVVAPPGHQCSARQCSVAHSSCRTPGGAAAPGLIPAAVPGAAVGPPGTSARLYSTPASLWSPSRRLPGLYTPGISPGWTGGTGPGSSLGRRCRYLVERHCRHRCCCSVLSCMLFGCQAGRRWQRPLPGSGAVTCQSGFEAQLR